MAGDVDPGVALHRTVHAALFASAVAAVAVPIAIAGGAVRLHIDGVPAGRMVVVVVFVLGEAGCRRGENEPGHGGGAEREEMVHGIDDLSDETRVRPDFFMKTLPRLRGGQAFISTPAPRPPPARG